MHTITQCAVRGQATATKHTFAHAHTCTMLPLHTYKPLPPSLHQALPISVLVEAACACVFACIFVCACVHVSVSVCEPHSKEGKPFWLRSPPPRPPPPPGTCIKKKRKGFPLPPSLIQTRLYFEMLALYNSWESANLARKARRRRICWFLPPQASLSLSLRPYAHSLSSALDASPKMRRQAGHVA